MAHGGARDAEFLGKLIQGRYLLIQRPFAGFDATTEQRDELNIDRRCDTRQRFDLTRRSG